MADYNETHFNLAKLGDIEFPVVSKTMRGGRRVSRHTFPLRDGQAVENQGRAPRVISLQIALYRGMGENFYPTRRNELVELVENTYDRGSVQYVDQEFGPLPVTIVDYEWLHDAERRGGGVLSLTLEEDNLSAGVDGISEVDLRGYSFELATRFDFAIDALSPVVLQEFQEEVGFLDKMNDFVDEFYSDIDDIAVAVDDYAAYLDNVVNTFNRIINYPPFSNLENWSIVNSVIDLVGALTQAVKREQSAGPTFSSYVVQGEASVYAIAQDKYGDAVYGDEITFNNDITNPMVVPAGTVLRMVER